MPPVGSDWQLTFHDHFDGAAIDASKWVVESLPNAGGATVANSLLRMRCDNADWNFVRLYTANRFRFQYGYMEALMKWPAGLGYWPGFSTYEYDTPGTQVAEIDVMEQQGGSPTIHRMHYHYHQPIDYSVNYNPTYSPGTDWTQDYHLYAALWEPGLVTFFVDGIERGSTAASIGNAATNIWLQNILDLAGNYGGPPDGSTPYPGDVLVDYVSVWQRTAWRGYTRVQCSDVTVNDATFQAELERLGISVGVYPHTKSHPRRLGTRDYVLEYASEQALTVATIANALFRRLGIVEATLLAALIVTTYAGSTWDERRAACKTALGL